MSDRHIKGPIVEKVEHPQTKRVGVIRLYKGSMSFFARETDGDPQQPPFVHKDGGKVREWLLQQLARTTEGAGLEWLPVVEIVHGGERRHRYRDETQAHGESMALEFRRYFIALTLDKREWRRLPWESADPESATALADAERWAASDHYDKGPRHPRVLEGGAYPTKAFRLPHFSDNYNGQKVVIAYTPDLWRGLLMVNAQIAASRKALERFVGTKDGVAMVAELGAGTRQLLLGSGT